MSSPDPLESAGYVEVAGGEGVDEQHSAGTSVRILSDETLPDGAGLFRTTASDPRPFDSKEHKARTRRTLAVVALSILGVFHAAILTLLALDIISLSELTGIVAAFSGLQALTSVAFAFYFAKS